ncbi:hypothetical protein JNB63_05000 [Microbacterium trichothecenolyticum]|uniref:hypothetical protein n=1 Tax=Microbacterium trichothecenolyticum TaxID=69370 RepID=UPI001C6F3B1E|nr:hypothetical protein [Microbacterium trichothecenolyticum]MBW9119445.1 hypothetical protein [Microbacterium trichothecenolyticum]
MHLTPKTEMDERASTGADQPEAVAPLPRRWLTAHLITLGLVLILLVAAARGQYFYYDEWDFLATRAEWNLLTPHVGHLSFFPQLLTTLTKGVFGLHSYWPYILPTIAMHLLIIHLLWRVMMRAGSQPVLALVGAVLFGVLAPGADNTLWAFQIGFITPFAMGLAAILLAMRSGFGRRDLIWITVLLVGAAGFSGTALPMAGGVILFLLVNRGWRAAVVPGLAFGLIYGSWYVLFNRAPSDWDALRADTPWELVIGVPQFVAHGFVDSVAQFLPLEALSAVLLVILAGWVIIDIRRTGVRHANVAHYLLLALLAFAVLTAISRVGLGNASASAPRYAYVYGLLLMAATVLALTALTQRSRAAIGAVVAVLTVLAGYNAGGMMVAADTQRVQEQTVPRAMSAALSLVGCDDDEFAKSSPAGVVAPTLTMADICSFVDRGQFDPVEYTDADLLDVRINLLVEARHLGTEAPAARSCSDADSGDAVPYDAESEFIYVPDETTIRLHAQSASGTHTQYARIMLPPGVSRLEGADIDEMDVRLAEAPGLCVFIAG